MGIEEKERKVRKRNDKKFVFDWNADDDTSRDLNPIYTHKHSAQLFGRGHFAGIDVKDNKGRDQFYDKMLANRRTEAESARAEYVPHFCFDMVVRTRRERLLIENFIFYFSFCQ